MSEQGTSARRSGWQLLYGVVSAVVVLLWVGSMLGGPVVRAYYGAGHISQLMAQVSSSAVAGLVVLTLCGYFVLSMGVFPTSADNTRSTRSRFTSSVAALVVWIVLGGVLIFLFNANTFTAHDRRVVDLLVDLGPMFVLIAVWIAFMLVFTRRARRDALGGD